MTTTDFSNFSGSSILWAYFLGNPEQVNLSNLFLIFGLGLLTMYCLKRPEKIKKDN